MKHLLTIAILLVSSSSWGYYLTIKVYNSDSVPVSGINIYLYDSSDKIIYSGKTKAAGIFNYSTKLKYLTIDIRSKELSYKSSVKSIYNDDRKDLSLEIYLENRSESEIALISAAKQRTKVIATKNALFCPDTLLSGNADTASRKEVHQCLLENINYPTDALASGIEGKVYLKFVVDITGEIRNLSVVQGTYAIFEEEALRAASCISGLKPLQCEGQAIPTYYMLPITFKSQ